MIKNLVSTAIIILGLVFTLNTNASDYGPVAAKETLWDIASRNRPSYDITTQQMMLAIRRANPSAFQTKNINSLKAGAILNLPSMAEIERANKSTALNVAKQQNSRWQAKKNRESSSKKSRSYSSTRTKPSSSKYKRYYKASQRELRKLQRRLEREQRKVRRLKRKLAQAEEDSSGVTPSSTGNSGNLSVLQDEVKSLENTIQEKNVHIAQLENIKKVATETIKKQAETNEVLFNKLKAIAPNEVINESASSGSLQLQGIDTSSATNNTDGGQANALLPTTGKENQQAISAKDNGFIIAIAVLTLLFALALLWRVFSQYNARKSALKPSNDEESNQALDKEDEKPITHRQEPVLST